jgi:hypothetical protein
MECPYCWQHYEIAPGDREKDFVCICCDQTFNGRDALVIPANDRKLWIKVAVSAGVVATVLLALNIFLWRQLNYTHGIVNKLVTVEAGKPVGKNAKSAGAAKVADPASVETVAAVIAAAPAVGMEKNVIETLEMQIASLTGRIEALTEEQQKSAGKFVRMEQQINAVVKGLGDARAHIRGINIENRLGELEKTVFQLTGELKAATPAKPGNPASPK